MSKLMIVALVALAGCKDRIHVGVVCRSVEGPMIQCDVFEDRGTVEAEACWDISITCGNGAVVGAPRTCAKVKDGGTTKVTVPGDKLTNLDSCGGTNPQLNMTHMTIDGQAVDEMTTGPLNAGSGSAK
jgi:hypothetical protein